MVEIELLDMDEQIEVAFLAVYNKHISFKALTNHFPPRAVKDYLMLAILDYLDPTQVGFDIVDVYPRDVTFYMQYMREFETIFNREDFPEVWI